MEEALFQRLLQTISRNLSTDDIVALKQQCRCHFKKRRFEEIRSASGLWEALLERDLICVTDTHYMKKLLHGREYLLGEVNSYESHRHDRTTSNHGPKQHIRPHTVMVTRLSKPIEETAGRSIPNIDLEITFLERHLGTKWKMFARELGLEEHDIQCISLQHSGDLRKQLEKCMATWRNRNPFEASRERLMNALRACNFHFLADQLQHEITVYEQSQTSQYMY